MDLAQSVAQERIELSAEQKQRIARRARLDLIRILLAQFAAAFLAGLLFFAIQGWGGFVSAIVGAACYLIPNSVLVLRMVVETYKPRGANVATLLIGNAVKVLVTIGLLWLVADVGQDSVHWVAVFVGLIVALKGYWLGLLLTGGKLAR
jgi:ATP synthase protein I